MSESGDEQTVNEHYKQGNLAASIFDALRVSGKYHSLSEEDLAPVDQFHIGGKEATLDLARLADVKPGMRILDVGGGIGGPARTIADKYKCYVDVLDITEEYCRVGEMLTTRADLKDLIMFYQGSALDIPFPHMNFDLVWTQHSSMNISDKERLYSEIYRVLKPHGRLALHEIMAGESSPIYFPVPWARHPAISFLNQPENIRMLIQKLGFKELAWIDESQSALEWFNKRTKPGAAAQKSPLGLHLLLGDGYNEMIQNQIRNLEEGKISLIKAIFEKE